MSYSFTVRAATKAEALAKIAEQLEGVVKTQAAHLADREQALAAAESFIAILADDESKDVVVSMNGSVSWNYAEDKEKFTNAAVSVSAFLVAKEAT